jgi:kinesin family protein 18/19
MTSGVGRYAFDYVFDADDDQTMVYSNTTKFLIQGLLDGFNATVFAYGQVRWVVESRSSFSSSVRDTDGSREDVHDDRQRAVPRHHGQHAAGPVRGVAEGRVFQRRDVSADGRPVSRIFVTPPRIRYKVTVSFLEVYNENIRDLLSDVEEYLDLREDPLRGPTVAGITEVQVQSAEEIMTLLNR